jgi:hypothetical protein
MDGASDEFLAGAGFAGDEHGGIGGRNFADSVEDSPDGVATSEQIAVAGHFADASRR